MTDTLKTENYSDRIWQSHDQIVIRDSAGSTSGWTDEEALRLFNSLRVILHGRLGRDPT